MGNEGRDFASCYEAEREPMARTLLVIGGDAEAARDAVADGTRLLLNIAPPGTTVPNRLVVVDLVAGTARVVFEARGVEGFWAADDRTAIVVGGGAVVAVDTVTGTATTIDDHPSEGFQVIAAA